MTKLITVSDDQNQTAISAAKSAEYFSRVTLCQAAADLVQEGKIAKGGHFALTDPNGQVIDLGTQFEALVCAGRAKAIQFGDPLLLSFDPESETYQQIARSATYGSSRMAGPDYLLWFPELDAFATLFCYNATLKGINDAIFSLMHSSASFESYFYKGPKNSWHKVKVTPGSEFDVPQDRVSEAINAFRNEKPMLAESAPQTSRER